MRKRLSAPLFALLACAASCPAKGDRDEVRRLMGRNDRLLLEIQLATAGDVDAEVIRNRLTEMERSFRAIGSLRPFRKTDRNERLPAHAGAAATETARLNADPWTPSNRQDRFTAVKAICASCHNELVVPP